MSSLYVIYMITTMAICVLCFVGCLVYLIVLPSMKLSRKQSRWHTIVTVFFLVDATVAFFGSLWSILR